MRKMARNGDVALEDVDISEKTFELGSRFRELESGVFFDFQSGFALPSCSEVNY